MHTDRHARSSCCRPSRSPSRSPCCCSPPPERARSPARPGPGGPGAVVADPGDPFGTLLRRDPASGGPQRVRGGRQVRAVAATLAQLPVVLLARLGQRRAGLRAGRLGQRRRQPDRHAARPAAGRAPRLAGEGGTVRNGYLGVDTAWRRAPASRRRRCSSTAPPTATLTGATASPPSTPSATTATASPGRVAASVGTSGGQAAAFTYDLARSVVYTRQGNPAWAGHRARRPRPPIRSDDLFFGAAGTRLARPRQVADPAGRRAAAPAGQPDHADDARPRCRCRASGTCRAAKGRGRHDRRRPRAVVARPTLRALGGREPGRLLGRQLGVRPRRRRTCSRARR